MGSVALSSPSSRVISPSSTICCSSEKKVRIPKLEPFSRSKFDRVVEDPPLIQKSENEIADYCSTLDGDPSYSCWRAYFELKDLEKESPKQELEKLIIQAGGLKSLISCIHGISAIHKAKKEPNELHKLQNNEDQITETPPHVPDGLPKSEQEIEEEERDKMPDSPYTRMLRAIGKFPKWYSPAPDHEHVRYT